MGAVYSSPTMAMYVHSLLCMYVCLQGAYLHSNIQFFVCVDSMRVIVDLRAAKYCFTPTLMYLHMQVLYLIIHNGRTRRVHNK